MSIPQQALTPASEQGQSYTRLLIVKDLLGLRGYACQAVLVDPKGIIITVSDGETQNTEYRDLVLGPWHEDTIPRGKYVIPLHSLGNATEPTLDNIAKILSSIQGNKHLLRIQELENPLLVTRTQTPPGWEFTTYEVTTRKRLQENGSQGAELVVRVQELAKAFYATSSS